MHIDFHTLLWNSHDDSAWNIEFKGFCSCGGDLFVFYFLKKAYAAFVYL